MNKIGIIVAMEEEQEEILNIMNNIEEKDIYEVTVKTGQIGKNKVVVAKCGVGKVNAARVTQILIDKLNVNCIINVGSAGALNPLLNIGDIVIGEKLVQHDFDITAFGHEKGYITDTGRFFKSDEKLIKRYKKDNNEYKIIVGIIASGDIFCNQVAMKEKIRSKFGADCVEMEGAAIAQVATLNKIPFIVIRSISDKPNGRNHIDIEKFVNMASKRCADLVIEPTIHP